MLQSISKAAYRVRSVETALPTIREAVRVAQTAPSGPVSVEIPIDIQAAAIEWPADMAAPHITTLTHCSRARRATRRAAGERKASAVVAGRRRARMRQMPCERLVALGFGVVTSVQGRGVVPEDHPATLGAFNVHPAVESFYKTCDALVVVGSRLRGNETLQVQARTAAAAAIASTPTRSPTTAAIATRCSFTAMRRQCSKNSLRCSEDRLKVDPAFAQDLASARESARRRCAARASVRTSASSMRCSGSSGPRLQLGARRHGLEQHVGQPLC